MFSGPLLSLSGGTRNSAVSRTGALSVHQGVALRSAARSSPARSEILGPARPSMRMRIVGVRFAATSPLAVSFGGSKSHVGTNDLMGAKPPALVQPIPTDAEKP